MELVKKHGTTILISLCIGIFLFYIQTPLKLAGDSFIKFLTFTSNNYSEFYYQSVGLNDPNALSNTSNFILIIILFILLVAVNMYSYMTKKNLDKKVKKTIQSIKTLKEELQSNKSDKKVNAKDTLQEITETETTLNKIDENLSKLKNLLIGAYISSSFVIVILFYNYAVNTSVSSDNLKFRNDLIKITPYVTDNEIKTIQAKWTLMKNKSDFDNITDIISQLKNKHKIE